jgi:hypothetical protein
MRLRTPGAGLLTQHQELSNKRNGIEDAVSVDLVKRSVHAKIDYTSCLMKSRTFC